MVHVESNGLYVCIHNDFCFILDRSSFCSPANFFFPILMLMFECLLEYFVGVGWHELHAAGTAPMLLDSKMCFATAVVGK